jgi:ABC-type uncharacterized transport system substrate-binding protein
VRRLPGRSPRSHSKRESCRTIGFLGADASAFGPWTPLEIRRAEDVVPAFEAIKAQADAFYVVVDQLVVANRTRILALALGAKLPTIFSTGDFVRAGGFMSYGPSYADLFRHSADYVDKILRGASPAIYRSSSRPSSSWSSISRPPKRSG